MHKRIATTAKTILLSAGFIALGTGVSYADVETSGDGAVLSGNQAVVDANAPINATGNSVAGLGGISSASSQDSNAVVVDRDSQRDVSTSGDGSVGSGNQIVADADVPINVSGNSVAGLVGFSAAGTSDSDAVVHNSHDKKDDYGHGDRDKKDDDKKDDYGNGDDYKDDDKKDDDKNGDRDKDDNSGGGIGDVSTSGDGSVLSGNQVVADADVPVNATGNSVAALGGLSSAGSSDSDAVVVHDAQEEQVEEQSAEAPEAPEASEAPAEPAEAPADAPVETPADAPADAPVETPVELDADAAGVDDEVLSDVEDEVGQLLDVE